MMCFLVVLVRELRAFWAGFVGWLWSLVSLGELLLLVSLEKRYGVRCLAIRSAEDMVVSVLAERFPVVLFRETLEGFSVHFEFD